MQNDQRKELDMYKTKQNRDQNHDHNFQRTSDGGNGNRRVSLPIIMIKIEVDQMLPSSYKSSLFVSILHFCI